MALHAIEWIWDNRCTLRRLSSLALRKTLQRQPGECTWCGKTVPKGRKTWCSARCWGQYQSRFDAGHIRSLVRARDKGVCQLCKLDTAELRKFLNRGRRHWGSTQEVCTRWRGNRHVANRRGRKNLRRLHRYQKHHRAIVAWLFRQGRLGEARADSHLWEADHIIRVEHGGLALGLSNVRTLCIRCHRRVVNAPQHHKILTKRLFRRLWEEENKV